MKKTLLAATAIAAAMAMGASAATTTNILDEWTFTSATPWVSDLKAKTMGNWDTNTFTTTTVPSAGLLRDATGGNSSGAWYGDNLGLAESFDSLTLTVDIADINHSQRDHWLEFLGTVGGNTRLDIDAFNGNISIDVWGAGTELSGPAIFNTNDYTGAISMQVVATWDFANSNLSYTVTGDGVGYTGAGSSAFTNTASMAADLSGIANITSMRVRGGTVGAGEYIDLDNVRIETMVTVEDPPPPAEGVTVDTWVFTNATPWVSDIQGKTMGNWNTNTFPTTTVPSAGLLRDATGGNSSGAWYGDNLGLAEMPDRLTLTVEIADITHTERDYWFEFFGPGAGAGNFRAEINAFNGNISFDVEGNGNILSPAGVFNVNDYSGAISMDVAFTWDFANDTLSYTMSGDGAGYTGTGSSAFSDTQNIAADLSGVSNLSSMRVAGRTVGAGEYIDLDTVTIETEVLSKPPTYEGWISSYPGLGSETNRTDNPDGDALNNLYEYGLGGNPEIADTGHEGTFQLAGSNMEYVHVQRNDDTNLVYSLEITDDLVNGTWTNLGYTVSGTDTNSGIANFDTVTNSIPTDVKDQQFIKLIIE